MSPGLAYVLGVATIPFVGAVVMAYFSWIETGREVVCLECGYSTGPSDETHRITCWRRWHWHKLTTKHHARRWRNRPGMPKRTRLGSVHIDDVIPPS